jgi:RNA polymerase sigma factor (sigma-70 family)
MMRMDRDQIIVHIPRLRRYARLLTGDAHRADDLVQDTLERACVKWQLWQPRVVVVGAAQTEPTLQLRAWLFTVMHNLFINQLRGRHSGRDNVQLDDVELESAGRDPGLQMDLERSLAQLPEDQREVLLLVALEDFSYAEAAILIDVPIGTVMSRLSRARKRLSDLMEGGPAVQRGRPQLKVMK